MKKIAYIVTALILAAPISASAQAKPKRDVAKDQTTAAASTSQKVTKGAKPTKKITAGKTGANRSTPVKSYQQMEKEAYEKACEKGTFEAFVDFIDRYPDGAHADEVLGIIDGFIWLFSVDEDTEEAYNDYLEYSPTLTHENEARNAIHEKRTESEWQRIKDSSNADDFSKYMTEFPQSPHYKNADYNHYILRGDQAYARNENGNAEYLYSQAANLYTLDTERQRRLNLLHTEMEYEQMKTSTNINQLTAYYDRLPQDSPYRVAIGSQLAHLKSKQLYDSSSSSEIKECLQFEQYPWLRGVVKSIIRESKGKRSPNATPRWWRHRAMVGWEIGHLDYSPTAYYTMVGTGLNLRLGRYCDAFNFIVGAGYQTLLDVPDFEMPTVHQMYGSAKFRFNMGGLAAKSKFFIGGGAVYERNFEETPLFCDYAIGIKPEMGFSGTHYDFGIYAKRYLDNYTMTGENAWHFGTNITWYF